MPKEVEPLSTNRAVSWQLFKAAPMPMVTLFKTIDITNLIRIKSKGYKLTMLLNYCIARAAARLPEFKLLPAGEKMLTYEEVGISMIAANKDGGINYCDMRYVENLQDFNREYLEKTQKVYQECQHSQLDDVMLVGTSALIKYDLDGAVNMYSGIFNNPFIVWGKYRTKGAHTYLRLSFQFHHVQMDGAAACEYLEMLQEEVSKLQERREMKKRGQNKLEQGSELQYFTEKE